MRQRSPHRGRGPRASPGLRLSAGRWAGRRLQVPPGARPTESRVREALFDRWQGALAGARLLDLFCGGGSVALEGLSRGVAVAIGFDADREAVRLALANAAHLGAGDAARFERADLPQALEIGGRRLGEPFDLVFADPPYGFSDLDALVERVDPWMGEAGEFVLEHSSRVTPPAAGGRLQWRSTRRYGESALSAYRRAD